jgi:hypothetical protein
VPDPQHLICRLAWRGGLVVPKCQSRMEVQHITSARPGFEHWTLRCARCGLIHEAQVNADPMKSDAIGWGAQPPESRTLRTMT